MSDEPSARPPLEVNRIVHEPARYEVMALLYVVERAEFLFVQNQLGLTPGNLSAHVTKLETAGYVAVEKKFVGRKPRTVLALTEEGRKDFDAYREQMTQRLSAPLTDPTAS